MAFLVFRKYFYIFLESVCLLIAKRTTCAIVSSNLRCRAGVLDFYSLIHPLVNFKSKIYPPNFFLSSLLQMPIVISKSVNILLTKFPPKED